jgi:predicted nucleic-acid-binding protein
MPLTRQEYDDREMLISQVVSLTLEDGRWSNSDYEMFLTPETYDVKVRDLRSGLIVAYSSTKADFEDSLVEFAEDYFA